VTRGTGNRRSGCDHEVAVERFDLGGMLPPRLFHDKRILVVVVLGIVLAATVIFATTGWGHGARLDRPPVAADATTSSVQVPGTTAPDPPTTARPSPITRVIQWMNEHGPTSGGASSVFDEAYILMMKGDCAGVFRLAEGQSKDEMTGPLRTLYLGAASACLAAFHGRAELWPRADAALERMTSRAPRLDCESRAVYELLKRLVEAHRAAPSARLVKQPVGRRALACPRFTRITPNHGPAEGGYTVRIEGEDLPPVVGVNFSVDFGVNHHSEAVLRDGRYVEVTVPRPAHPEEPASVMPDGARLWTGAEVEFRYDPPASTTSTTTTTTTSTTTTTRPPGTTTSTTAPSSSTSG